MVSTTLRETSFLCGVMGLHDEICRASSASSILFRNGFNLVASLDEDFHMDRLDDKWLRDSVCFDTHYIRHVHSKTGYLAVAAPVFDFNFSNGVTIWDGTRLGVSTGFQELPKWIGVSF